MRKSYMSRILLPAVALLLAATSCSEKKWHIEGSVDGAGGKQIIVEAPNAHGGWYPIDTVEVASDGTFKVAGEAFGHPELVRLSLDGATAYLPVDSIETVTFAAKGNAFAATARISGTPSADKMQEVNDLITKVAKAQGSAAAPFDQDLKRSLAEVILRDPADIVAYYLIFHKVGDTPLYSPKDRSDLRIIGAVANAYTQLRPADPRTPLQDAASQGDGRHADGAGDEIPRNQSLRREGSPAVAHRRSPQREGGSALFHSLFAA